MLLNDAESPTEISARAAIEALTASDLDPIFWTPSRARTMSAWWGHVPFAHWLVAAIRPALTVELGTHHGVSFAALCEAMQRQNVVGCCYAVDTWKGDEHAGYYDESVFVELEAFRKSRYAAFSELIRLTFDEALLYFADRSVDLLHIDGLHTYEAVKRDFDNWLPKLSSRAVVLFHDTNVRERGFGVWQLWAELRKQYPSFEFHHGHGLGIAAVGRNMPEPIALLCGLEPGVANVLRERFAQLGARWMAADLAERTEEHVQNLIAQNERQGRSLAEHAQHVAKLEAEHERAAYIQQCQSDRLAALNAELNHERAQNVSRTEQQSARIEEQSALIEEQSARLKKQSARLKEQSELIEALWQNNSKIIDQARQDAESNEHRVHVLKAKLASVRASKSWRITKPLRTIESKFAQSRVSRKESITGPVSHLDEPDPDIDLIANSGMFDEISYGGADDARDRDISVIEHYILEGEAAGLSPSPLFDPIFYSAQNPDLSGASINKLAHYIRFGKNEGRRARSVADGLHFPLDRVSADRETVIVAVHEATRTGAPILAWNIIAQLQKRYNVIALLKRGGPIEQAIEDISCGTVTLPEDFTIDDAEIDALARKFVQHYSPKYLIANSVETRYFVPSFERMDVPVVVLIHEFSSTVRPPGALHQLFQTASQIVFSAKIVADSALADYHALAARAFNVVPQGVSRLPPNNKVADSENHVADRSFPPDDDGSMLVVGIGTITMRKGVEFFIAAAASVQRRKPPRQITFAWIGKCYSFDQPYLDYLSEQVKRSEVANFLFMDELEDLEPVYARANICFLSSRLDPLPNIAIDSAIHGIPVVCFDLASGIAEILKASQQTQELVVPYLDAEAAAQLIVEMYDNRARLSAFSEAMRVVANKHFDMVRYVDIIDRLGCKAVRANKRALRDYELIAQSGSFNPHLYLGVLASTMTTHDAIKNYLRASGLVAPRGRPRTGIMLRRPLEGFHPLIYASENPAYDEASGEDPLSHYIRTGFPAGRWQHDIICPHTYGRTRSSHLRVAVHGHFHYPELLIDFCTRLKRNQTTVDLLLTTSSDDSARVISDILSYHGVQRATITIVPNRGRDIGPLLTEFCLEMLCCYDVVGHFHGKRSPHVDASIGENWRNFLWENLVGGDSDMMDVIMAAFESDRTIGLVFPEDPHLNDWDENRNIANDLAARMGLQLPLPNHIDFPQGNMFWARPLALKPLFDVGLTWDSYPEEPLPIDGTLVHALERLVPLSTAQAGYRYATTYLNGPVVR